MSAAPTLRIGDAWFEFHQVGDAAEMSVDINARTVTVPGSIDMDALQQALALIDEVRVQSWRPWICPECGKRYGSLLYYARHLRGHEGLDVDKILSTQRAKVRVY